MPLSLQWVLVIERSSGKIPDNAGNSYRPCIVTLQTKNIRNITMHGLTPFSSLLVLNDYTASLQES